MHVPTLSFDLGEEIDLLRESVAQFAAAQIAPLAEEADATNHFPNQLWRQLGEQGLAIRRARRGPDRGGRARICVVTFEDTILSVVGSVSCFP